MKYCETAVLSEEVEKIKVYSLCETLAYILISSNELEVTCDAHRVRLTYFTRRTKQSLRITIWKLRTN